MGPEPSRDEPSRAVANPEADGGEPVCWADQVCAECGRIDGHRPECSQASTADLAGPAEPAER